MIYKKIDIITNTEGSELISSFLYDYAEGGVVINDSRDLEQAVRESIYDNSDRVIEINDDVIVTAYITIDSFADAITIITGYIGALDKGVLGKLTVTISDYQSEDYDSVWKSYHKPIELDKIIIIPEWYDITSDKKIIRLHIGSSFGTGQHETTILALRFLESIDCIDKSVIDLGCGSGILGLAALTLGARHAYMCDIESIDEAKANAAMNGLSDKCTIESKDLALCNIKGDIVMSNIYAPVLCQHKDVIMSSLNDNGILILSGLYRDGLNEVKRAFENLTILNEATSDDWSSIMMVKYGA